MNLLWIVTTQWRAQACGYAGDPNARTPVLDALAAKATQFSEAVTPHPFGPFARAAMLTGVPCPENGVRDYFDPLPASARTLAHAMEELGVETAFFGKWHLAPRNPQAALVGPEHARTWVPEARRGGFRFWEGFEGGFQLNHPWLHGTRLPEPTQFTGYQSDVLCDRAGDWLNQHASSPWFCVVSLEPPHPPYAEAPRASSERRPRTIQFRANVPPDAAVKERAARELAGYYEHIEATDAAIGRLLPRIDTSNTAVVFTSVHGDMHGSHGLFRKGWPYEESVRVPLLVALPRNTAGIDRRPISLLGLPALSVAWMRDGRLVRPQAAAARISMPSVVHLPHQCDRIWRGARSAQRKLVLNQDGSPWLAFDLERDPFELDNLAADPAQQDSFGELRALLCG